MAGRRRGKTLEEWKDSRRSCEMDRRSKQETDAMSRRMGRGRANDGLQMASDDVEPEEEEGIQKEERGDRRHLP